MTHVVLVEDSRSVRARIRLLMEQNGFEIVAECTSEEQALYELDISKPEMVIIDLQLRKGSGLKVLRNLKKTLPSATAVILTSYDRQSFQRPCLKAGADQFFEKDKQFREFALFVKNYTGAC